MKQRNYWLIVFLLLIFLVIIWEAEKKFVVSSQNEVDLRAFAQRRSLAIQCYLCPQECYLADGEFGQCKNKLNLAGQLLFWDMPLAPRKDEKTIIQ